ncbi:MAG: sulfatase [Acidobacteriota bacterium]
MLILCGGLAALLAAGCGSAGSAARNAILISVDTLRQDALGCYGNPEVRTPSIDALARDGVLFRQAFTHAPSTLPSHTSMLFSNYPWNLGVFRNGDSVPMREDSIQQILKQHGLRTAAFISLAALSSSYKLSQGFDEYSDVSQHAARPYLFADELNDRILTWLSAHHEDPFFLFIHYSDPHEPYIPKDAPADVEVILNERSLGTFCFPKREYHHVGVDLDPGRNSLVFKKMDRSGAPVEREYEIEQLRVGHAAIRMAAQAGELAAGDEIRFTDSAELVLHNPTSAPIATEIVLRGKASLGQRETRRNYLREVEWVDRAIGELVACLRAHDCYEDTIMLLLADHGEGLGEHASFGHESQLYLSQLRIPYVMLDHRHVGLDVSSPVTPLDLAPTILSRLGKTRPQAWKGRDLNELLDHPAEWDGRQTDILSATFYSGRGQHALTNWKFSVLHPPHHLIITLPMERYEFYDINADPGEKRNLIRDSEHPDGYDELVSSARELARQLEEQLRLRKTPDLSPEQIEQLKSLGYLGETDQ